MTRTHVLAGIAAVALLSGGCASVEPVAAPKTTLEKIKASKTIAFGYRESSVPFSMVGPGNKPVGYSVDLCNKVADDLRRELQMPDLAVKWVPVTVQSRIGAVRDGTIDLECGSTTNTLSRQAEVDFSLTTFVTGGSLLALRETATTELKNLRIAVIPGTTTERALKEAMAKAQPPNVQLVPVKDHAEGRAAVENKTADTYASDRDILVGLALTASNPAQFALSERYFSYEPYGLMMRRGDPDFRIAVNRALARIYRNGEVLEIYSRWLGPLGAPGALQIAVYAIEGLPD